MMCVKRWICVVILAASMLMCVPSCQTYDPRYTEDALLVVETVYSMWMTYEHFRAENPREEETGTDFKERLQELLLARLEQIIADYPADSAPYARAVAMRESIENQEDYVEDQVLQE